MKNPRDFPKALWAVTIAEMVVFTVCGAVMYHYTGTVYLSLFVGCISTLFIGNQYVTSPAFASLQPTFKKIAFSFAIPTIVFLGSLYSVCPCHNHVTVAYVLITIQSVTARFVFFRIFQASHHRHSNTVLGWSTWAGIIATSWIAAFVIAEVIPFFSDMLSVMSSLFGIHISL